MATKPVHGHAHHHAHRAHPNHHHHHAQKAHKGADKPTKADKPATAPQAPAAQPPKAGATPPKAIPPQAAAQPPKATTPPAAATPPPQTPVVVAPKDQFTPPAAPQVPQPPVTAPKDQYTPPATPPVDLQPGATGEHPLPPSAVGAPAQTPVQAPALPAPDISDADLQWIGQLDPTGASADYQGEMYCGPAAGAMIARECGYEPKLSDGALVEKLAGFAQTDEVLGTTGNGMLAMYEEMGLETAATAGANMEWINAELAAGHYLTALGNYYAVPGRVDDSQVAGHYVDVTSYEQEQARYAVSDPADEALNWMTVAQLQNFITSSPQGGFCLSCWASASTAVD